MNPGNVQKHRDAQSELVLQHLEGHEKFHVLDMHNISMAAPSTSAPDGVHYTPEVYNAAFNVLLNMIAADPVVAAASGPCDGCDIV